MMEVRGLPGELINFARAECERLQVPGTAISVLYEGTIYAGGVGLTSVDNPRQDIIERILEHVARQQAPPEFSAISSVATVH
jgi:hypothetical protein